METATQQQGAGHKTVFIQRTFDLPVNKVWEAWTQPETFKKWWGPHNYTCPTCTIDLKINGRCFACMKDKKTGAEMWSVDTYKEIIPQEKLVMIDSFADKDGNIVSPPKEMKGDWSKPLILTITFKENEGKTDFTLSHENMPLEQYDDCKKGWQECLDKLAALQ